MNPRSIDFEADALTTTPSSRYLLNEKLKRFGVVHEDLSIDESMVPSYGRYSLKQFIRGKPVCFGYKLWVLARAIGFPNNVEILCMKKILLMLLITF